MILKFYGFLNAAVTFIHIVTKNTSHFLFFKENSRSERDLRSCEVTEAVTNKAQKKFWGSNGIRTHDLHDTGAMLYWLSYEALPEAAQVQVQFIPVILVSSRITKD